MGQALEMCVSCENKRGCDLCTDLHEWIMEHLEMENELKAYEDTGLEPEKVVFLKDIVEDAFRDKPDFTNKLRDLIKAEKDGRLVVLQEPPKGE